MYAIDGDHGHIARRLLEAGARPDLAGSEGVLPVDLAMTKGHANLQAIVGEYSKIRGIDLNMNKSNSNEDHLIQYSEVDNILLAVNAIEYLPAFKHHRFVENHSNNPDSCISDRLQWKNSYYLTFDGPILHFLVSFHFIYTIKCDQKAEYGTIKSWIVRISPQ